MPSKNSMECLISSIIVFCGLVACFFVTLKYFSGTYHEINSVEDRFAFNDAITAKQCKPVCTSKECLRITKRLLTYIDVNTDPCQDFYNFSCGNYFTTRYPSYGDVNHDVFRDAATNMHFAVKQFLGIHTKNQKSKTIGKIRKLFSRCMNRTTSDGMSIKGILNVFWRIGLQDWPHLTSDWTIRNVTRDVLLSHFHSMDSFSFIRLSLDDGKINYKNRYNENSAIEETDNKTSEKVVVDIKPDNLFLSNSVYLFESNISAFKEIHEYKKLIQDVLHLFGVPHNLAKGISEHVVQLEKKIAKIFQESESAFNIYKRNVSNNETFYFNCSRNLPSSGNRWCSYLQAYVNLLDLDVSAFEFSTYNFILLDRLKDFVDKISHKILADFLSVRFILSKSKHINSVCHLIVKYNKLFSAKHESCEKIDYSLVFDLISSSTRWKFCTMWISDKFDVVIGLEFVTGIYNSILPEEFFTVHESVKNAAIATFQKITWVTEKDKKCIIDKVNSSKLSSCSIANAINFRIIDEFYTDLLFAGESFTENLIEYDVFIKRFKYKTYFKLYHPVGTHNCAILDANIYIQEYTLLMTAEIGIFQFPFFESHRPPHIHIRTIGNILAHEFGHAFHLAPCSNKSEATVKNFELRKHCLINQYSKYEIGSTGIHLNGSEAFRENFADNFAPIITEVAYETVKKEYGPLWLPSVNFSDEKLLYIFFSQMFCEAASVINPPKLVFYYSPYRYRVLGPLTNIRAFSESFSCANGKHIRSNKTCTIF